MQHMGCSALPGVLPSEGLGIGHPFALGAQDLFGDVPSATVAAAQVAHIEAGVTYLGGGIGRTARSAAQAHHGIVGDVIAHIEHLLRLEVEAPEQVFIHGHLV